ncbi:PH domain-containing protein [Candidatus Saccharibacteria bacterium]|nr:PH domain-containing protein [Candidatus Saccharibacteria bacterium]
MAKTAKQPNAAPQKAKYFDDQFDDEDVLLVFRRHPVVMRKGLVLGMIGLLLGTLPALVKPEYSYFFGGLAAGFILMIVLFMPAWISWYFSVFIVTDQRFIQVSQKGLFHKSVVDISLQQIKSLNYEIAGLQETMLGFGTILIQTYIGDLVVKDIHHPAKIQKQIAEILREHGVEPYMQNEYGTDDETYEEEN